MVEKNVNGFIKEVNITYSVRENTVEENVHLVRNIIKQLEAEKLQGIKYSSYLMGKNVFIHTAQFTSLEASKNFEQLEAFTLFRNSLNSKLEDGPIVNEVKEIGSYTAFDVNQNE